MSGVRDAMLGARGKTVVSVPWDEWATREDRGVATAWLRERLEEAGVIGMASSSSSESEEATLTDRRDRVR